MRLSPGVLSLSHPFVFCICLLFVWSCCLTVSSSLLSLSLLSPALSLSLLLSSFCLSPLLHAVCLPLRLKVSVEVLLCLFHFIICLFHIIVYFHVYACIEICM